MRSYNSVKAAKIGYIAASVAVCLLGLVIMIYPQVSLSVLGISCGVMCMLFGIIRLIGYFSRDLYRLAFQYDLTSGLLLIALGIIMLVRPSWLMIFICIALGLFILADGLFKIQIAVDSKRFGLGSWWLILILALITAAAGLVLMLRPGSGGIFLTVLIGINLLSEGILNVCTAITAVKVSKKMKEIDDAVEADFRDISDSDR